MKCLFCLSTFLLFLVCTVYVCAWFSFHCFTWVIVDCFTYMCAICMWFGEFYMCVNVEFFVTFCIRFTMHRINNYLMYILFTPHHGRMFLNYIYSKTAISFGRFVMCFVTFGWLFNASNIFVKLKKNCV